MSLPLKAELETWAAALKAYDGERFIESVELFSGIAKSSKIATNIGLIYATDGEHELAVQYFNEATRFDSYHAIAYFQCGVSNFLLGQYADAHDNFNKAYLALREHLSINYEQLGLKFRLFSAEVLFNRGLSLINLGCVQEGIEDIKQASEEKQTSEHAVIDDALGVGCAGYTVFSIPVGVLYRPPENKIKNSKSKDYLGKAKLVAASDINDVYTDFSGTTRLKQNSESSSQTASEPASSSNTSADLQTDSVDILGSGAPKFNRSVTEPVLRASPNPSASSERSSAISEPRTVDRERGDGGWDSAQAPFTSPTMALQQPLHYPQTPLRTYSPLLTSQAFQRSLRTPTSPAQAFSSRRSQSVSHVRVNPAGVKLQRNNTSSGVSPTLKRSTGQGAVEMEDGVYGGACNMSQSPLQEAERSTPVSDRFARLYTKHATEFADEQGAYAWRSLGLPRNGATQDQLVGVPGLHSSQHGSFAHGAKSGNRDVCVIRVKLYYHAEVRGMILDTDTNLLTFSSRVATKLGVPEETLRLRFIDEDDVKISLGDEEDWRLAIKTARAGCDSKGGGRGLEGRLDVFCEERYEVMVKP